MRPRRPLARWRISAGDLAGGISGAIISVPSNIAIGFIALLPLGVAAQSAGIDMSLLAAGLGGLLFTSICGTRGLIAGGSTSFALVVAGVLASAIQAGLLQPGLAGLPSAFAVIGLLTVLTGLCEAVVAAVGLGPLVTMLPYPVVCGIRNGTALLMILLQLRPALGLIGSGTTLDWPHPAAALVSATVLALTLWPIVTVRHVPRPIVALVAGALLHHIMAFAFVTQSDQFLLGPLLDVPSDSSESVRDIAAGWSALGSLPIVALLPILVPGAITVALISTLETLVGASVIGDLSGEATRSRRDLFALAAANAGGGLFGTLPVTGGSPASMAVWSAGGRGKSAGILRAVLLLGILLLAGSVVSFVPVAALAGLVMSNGLLLFDRDFFRLGRAAMHRSSHRPELIGNVLVTGAVMATAVLVSLVAAVMIGAMLSVLLFVFAVPARTTRRRYRNEDSRSRIMRAPLDVEMPQCNGGGIEVIELQGAIFFASVDRLTREIDRAWAGGASCVIVDMSRVSQIDISGAKRLLQIATRLWRQGACFSFAGLGPGSPIRAFFDAAGLSPQFRPECTFAALSQALAAADQALLRDPPVGTGPDRPETARTLTGLGLDAADMATLNTCAIERHFEAGDVLIHAGSAAVALFILLDGRVEISIQAAGDERYHDLTVLTATNRPGEPAFLPSAPSAADIIAQTPTRCLVLPLNAIPTLHHTNPDVAQRLLTALAAQLTEPAIISNTTI